MRRSIGALGVAVLLCAGAVASAAESLAYQFIDDKQPVYEVKTSIEYSDQTRHSITHVAYDIRSVDPDNGQVTFTFNVATREWVTKGDQPAGDPPAFNGLTLFKFNRGDSPEVVIDRFGNTVRLKGNTTQPQTPVLGWPAWQLMLPPLPPNADKTWRIDQDVRVYDDGDRNKPRSESRAREIIDFTANAPEDGLIPITRKYHAEWLEKVGNVPIYEHNGEGTIVFNPKAGLVEAMQQTLLIQVNRKNLTAKYPVKASARRLSDDEKAKLKAEADQLADKLKVAGEQMRADMEKRRAEQDKVRAAQVAKRPSDAEAEKQFKAIAESWQKTDKKPVDILPDMLAGRKADADGVFVIGERQRISTPRSIKAPATFRVVVFTQGNDLRLAHAASQVIFNWEMRATELRVDGGPASGKHKPGVGMLEPKWVGIEWVVEANQMRIYVDGKEIYQADGDFSTIDRPFTITSHRGTTLIHSAELIQ